MPPMEACPTTSSQESVLLLQRVIEQLPRPNRDTLAFLITHLQRYFRLFFWSNLFKDNCLQSGRILQQKQDDFVQFGRYDWANRRWRFGVADNNEHRTVAKWAPQESSGMQFSTSLFFSIDADAWLSVISGDENAFGARARILEPLFAISSELFIGLVGRIEGS